MTIVEDTRVLTGGTDAHAGAPGITGGVDTHADTHVAAAPNPIGGLLGVREFQATAARYAALLGWLRGFGTVALAGVEGTGWLRGDDALFFRIEGGASSHNYAPARMSSAILTTVNSRLTPDIRG